MDGMSRALPSASRAYCDPLSMCHQVSALVSLGEVQTEEGHAQDAVETYLQVLALQKVEESDEVANAHVQASIIDVLISSR